MTGDPGNICRAAFASIMLTIVAYLETFAVLRRCRCAFPTKSREFSGREYYYRRGDRECIFRYRSI